MNRIIKSFKTLDIIFISILSMQIILALIFYFLRDMKLVKFESLDFEYLPIVVLVINTTVILFAKYIFTARNRIDQKLSLDGKLQIYKNYSLLLIAILDFLNVVNIVIFLLTGKQIYLLVALLILILYIVYRPNKLKFVNTTLSPQERNDSLSDNEL